VVSVVLKAESPEILLRPDSLAALDGLGSWLQERTGGGTASGSVGKVMGFTDLVKRINQVFNADESPDGIKANARATAGEDGGGFGFGGASSDAAFAGDGGFGFGFGDFQESGAEDYPAADAADYAAGAGEKTLTQNELVALFDRAGNVSRSMSASGLIWELKRLLNYEGASYYEIPANPKRYGKESAEDLQRLVSNYLVLLSGNISDYANDPLEPTAIKSTVQLRTLGMEDSGAVFAEIDRYLSARVPAGVEYIVGGTTKVEQSINGLVVQSQLVSVIISIICVFIILAVSNRSFAAGCVGIAPLSISVLINFAVMGFAGIKLNIGTSMVASVSVGVGIDYTIHCLEAFKREYRLGGDFLRRTFMSSGKAIIINAVSVGAGFAVLFFSRFNMLGDLGLLIAITMFSSALTSLTVLPALLTLIKPKFITTGVPL
jgi:predicted RND superfamily exporter protein